MAFPYRLVFLCSLISSLGLVSTLPKSQSAYAVGSCPTPALSRFQRHVVVRGETLESIAQRYNLLPETIIGMNTVVKNGTVTVGSELQIPPYNGIVVEVPRGQTWRQVAAAYKVRADALFEVNGCQQDPKIVFIPGVNWSPNRPLTKSPTPTPVDVPISRAALTGYPLPEVATVALPYGWQINPATGDVFFHSGVDLSAKVGTNVQAIAPGIVAFANEQGSYGKLVIINHSGGMQTRYAQLDTIKVTVGQQVKQGEELGTVGTSGQPTSSQPHLHFEVRASSSLGWVAEDPKSHLIK
ncbi:M23 family metallopeptidase [Calothrix sp. PCC 7507]|uniref:LysM peptidoglycan-binding domain-containing M23 family metallopeptidase n=1 Tax=Calothrix sp. PCC 7507 TaxID=99598 RepID=UPI00029ECBF4|nr:M23 family metallopeptidase [Calothrix sp. PCC 7507]AFY32252.1 Peptidase M23 [Calothrix sp. PCC 7507]